MAMLKRPGAELHYEIWGEGGDWVTLVNGHTRPLNDFRMLGRHLVDGGFRVLALDNRGAGQTTVERAFTLDEMAQDVVSLWDEVAIERGGLLGISMGGFISQTLALQYGKRIDKLILVSTAMHQRSIQFDDRPWSKSLRDNEAKLAPYFTATFAERNEMLVKSMAKQITKNVEEGRFSENSAWQRQAVAGFDAQAAIRAGGIQATTLVVHGEQDNIIPVGSAEETVEALRAGGGDAKLELYPDAGHLLLAERPKELYRTVSEWFRA